MINRHVTIVLTPGRPRSRPGIKGVCPKCTHEMQDGRYHDCGIQPPLPLEFP